MFKADSLDCNSYITVNMWDIHIKLKGEPIQDSIIILGRWNSIHERPNILEHSFFNGNVF